MKFIKLTGLITRKEAEKVLSLKIPQLILLWDLKIFLCFGYKKG